MVEHEKTRKNAHEKKNEICHKAKSEWSRKNVNVMVRAHFARQKELECQFSFLAHLHCYAADGRWAPIFCTLMAIVELFLPSPGIVLLGAFRKVGAKYSGYRQV
mmetsp:Transcript_13420/g.31013  ORF Transcript_13420/g.31013 Transcript_13420/m.31013 type:complete len:104 (+) Transcript_13420:316-627(+)